MRCDGMGGVAEFGTQGGLETLLVPRYSRVWRTMTEVRNVTSCRIGYEHVMLLTSYVERQNRSAH